MQTNNLGRAATAARAVLARITGRKVITSTAEADAVGFDIEVGTQSSTLARQASIHLLGKIARKNNKAKPDGAKDSSQTAAPPKGTASTNRTAKQRAASAAQTRHAASPAASLTARESVMQERVRIRGLMALPEAAKSPELAIELALTGVSESAFRKTLAAVGRHDRNAHRAAPPVAQVVQTAMDQRDHKTFAAAAIAAADQCRPLNLDSPRNAPSSWRAPWGGPPRSAPGGE